MHTRIKFCGMTDWEDVQSAADAGADSFGMIFAPSPRRITWEAAREIAERLDNAMAPVAVFVDPRRDEVDRVLEIFPNAQVQLCGNESPEFVAALTAPVLKVVHVAAQGDALVQTCARYPTATLLFDTATATLRGGTGETFAWERVASIARRRNIFIAGGLTAANVASCIRAAVPFGVDVRSGIETDARKDPVKMRAFVEAVRNYEIP